MTTILAILQHALGRDEYGHGTDYRNSFVTGPGGGCFALCNEAVAQGLMTDRGAVEMYDGDHVFTVTDAGKAYIAEHSPRPPKLTPGQVRYRRWLQVSDCYPGLTFGEWLKAERRAER